MIIKPLVAMTSVAIATAFVNFAGAASTVAVTPASMQGWAMQHAHCNALTSTGAQTFESGPATPPLGGGSLEMRTGTDGDSFETLRHAGYNNVLLSTVSHLSYSTYVEANNEGQAPYIILNIDHDNNGTLDDQLFFEPLYQSGYNSDLPDQGPVALSTWQTWDALHGGWWSLNGFADLNAGTEVKDLDIYLAQYPQARIINSSTGAGGVRIATGCGGDAWANFVGNVDNFTIGVGDTVTTYDFEADTVGPPTNVEECKKDGWKLFNNPAFKNQGECVSHVNSQKA